VRRASAGPLVLLLGLCACAWPGSGPSKPLGALPKRLGEVKRIGIMPIEASVMIVSPTDRIDPGVQDQDEADNEIALAELKLLRSRGFDTVLLPLREPLFTNEPELRFQVTQTQKTATAALQKALSSADRAGAEKTLRGSVDNLTRIADTAGADALLFTRFEGLANRGPEDGGEVAGGVLRWLFLPRLRDYYEVALCLVDAQSGRVLFAEVITASRESPGEMSELALFEFKR
jgi:hypothetical protein